MHGGEDVAYFKNTSTYTVGGGKRAGGGKAGKPRPYYTFTFVYEFAHAADRVYFAHCYPYTYSDLQRHLADIEQDKSARAFCKRRALCTSIAGNRCELLTITSYTEDPEVLRKRPGIVITARWVAMEGHGRLPCLLVTQVVVSLCLRSPVVVQDGGGRGKVGSASQPCPITTTDGRSS